MDTVKSLNLEANLIFFLFFPPSQNFLEIFFQILKKRLQNDKKESYEE